MDVTVTYAEFQAEALKLYPLVGTVFEHTHAIIVCDCQLPHCTGWVLVKKDVWPEDPDTLCDI